MARSRRSWSRGGYGAVIGLAAIGMATGWGGGTALASPGPAEAPTGHALVAPAQDADHKAAVRALTCPPSPLWANTGGGGDRLFEYSPTGTQLASVPLARDYGDIAFSADGTTLYGATWHANPAMLYTIDPVTGAETGSVTVTGPAASVGADLNGLGARPDGTLIAGSFFTGTIYTINPATGVSALLGVSYPGGLVSSGDFVTLADGDVLGVAFGSITQNPTHYFRIHPDNTITEIGTTPNSIYGLAQSGGNIYVFRANGTIEQLNSVPTASSTATLPTTVVANTGNAFYGATSVQGAGNCNLPAGTSYTVGKTVSPAGPVHQGDTLTYTETVTNTGTNPATAAGFSDDLSAVLTDATLVPGSVTASAGTANVSGSALTWSGTLTAPPAAGSTATVSYQVKVNNPDAGNLKVTNNVAPTIAGGTCATSGGCTTTVLVTAPAPSITKKAAEASFVTGQTIHYTYTVTNNSGVPLTNIAVVDNGPGTPAVTCPAGPLAPGASADCTATYTASAADATAGRIVDTAQLTATAAGQPVTVTSNEVTIPLRALTIVKSAVEAEFKAAGETIHYTYTVTNTGRTPLTGVSVSDLTPGVTVSGCGTNQLAVGESTTCQATYVTTAADVAAKNVPDRGQATGNDPGGQPVTATSNQVNTPLVAVLVVKKSAEAQYTAAGQTIHYTYTVTNNGARPLTNIAVVDNGPGTPAVTCPAGPLAPGASVACTATYTTTSADVAAGKVVDTANVSGTTPSGGTVTSTGNTVTVPYAGLKIVKAVQETAFSAAGQALHYTFTVTNTGNVALGSLAVTDIGPGSPTVTCPVNTLAPGASTTCTATYTTTKADVTAGKVTDSSTVSARTPDGTNVNATSNTLTVVACKPCEDHDHGGCDGHNPGGDDHGHGDPGDCDGDDHGHGGQWGNSPDTASPAGRPTGA
ncbi:beta strand repeat-containing protein [Kitasatospora purpeofusca]|uniref:beta strand repeat-containing protein n=1 Tax=Kitasatospora purpeofusca TaxID=67352 RepID=UPI003654C297